MSAADIKRTLFRPLSIGELAIMNAAASEGLLENHQVFETPAKISLFASGTLLMAEYCAHCAHRRVYHDGGLGRCRYDDCGCVCFYETKEHSA